MPSTCLFCSVVRGEVPVYRVHEDAHTLAFLDLHPIRPGHTLVIPKAHHTWFEEMPPELAAAVMQVAQRLARVMKARWKVERVAMFFTGIHVPHAHAHVLPMHAPHDVTSSAYLGEGLDGFSQPPRLSAPDMEAIASDIRARLENPASG